MSLSLRKDVQCQEVDLGDFALMKEEPLKYLAFKILIHDLSLFNNTFQLALRSIIKASKLNLKIFK